MRQIILDFGVLDVFGLHIPLRIHGYGLMMVFGFLLGIWLAQRFARRAGENPDSLVQCGILALVGGVIGARIAFVIEKWDTEFAGAGFGKIVNLTSGGLIYYGGVALAAVAVLVYLRARRLPVRRYLDILAPTLMIGLAFGRAGCTLNGCCFGGPARADWPLAIRFPMYSRPLVKLDGRENPYSQATQSPSPPYAEQMSAGRIEPNPLLVDDRGRLIPPETFTPEQLAVADASRSLALKPAQPLGLVNALILAAILTAFYRIRRREGQVFALLLILYPITRFILESIRADNPHNLLKGILTHNQWTSLATIAVGVIMMLVLRKLPASAGASWAGRAAVGGAGGNERGKRKRSA